MILSYTPYGLVLKTMQGEAEKVDFFMRRTAAKAKKSFERRQLFSDGFPFYYHETYTVPGSRNTYLVFYEALDRNDIRSGGFYCGSCLLVNDDNGKQSVYQLTRARSRTATTDEIATFINIYTGHFFSRYRERHLWGSEISTHELIVRYLCRNKFFMAGLEFEKLNLNANKYPNGSASQVFDGVVFITEKDLSGEIGHPAMAVRFNTFLGKHILQESQQDATFTQHEMLGLVAQNLMPG